MGDKSAIEWTDATFNPWIGCTKVGPGCDHCYAEAMMDRRYHLVHWGAGNPRSRTSLANWKQPLLWNAKPFYECGCGHRGTMSELTTNAVHRCSLTFTQTRRRVFCASLADVFDNEVPDHWRADLFDLIRRTPNLDWLLLTKRIGNAWAMSQRALWSIGMHQGMYHRLPDNVWLGATVVTQKEADRDIPELLKVPAASHFLSCEPLLEPITLDYYLGDLPEDEDGAPYLHRLKWLITGGESGPGARPCHPGWFRWLRDQCEAASVPFFFKQWGEWTPGENVERNTGIVETAEWFDNHWSYAREDLANEGGHIDDQPDLYRVGKKAAGRCLDGRTWDQFPEVSA